MSRLIKGITVGLFTGIAGLIMGLIPFGLDIEENVGLDILFNLRGTRQAPSDVIIINVDKISADNLDLPDDLWKQEEQP
jgi:adenylate cyclase